MRAVVLMTRLWAAALAALAVLAASAAANEDQQGAWASEVLAMSGPSSATSPRVETPPGRGALTLDHYSPAFSAQLERRCAAVVSPLCPRRVPVSNSVLKVLKWRGAD